MRIRHLIALLVLLVLVSLPAPAHAGGVVTVCDAANLFAALTGGGTVTFACSGTITLNSTITIAADTTIDGSGQSVTIRRNNSNSFLFFVSQNVAFDLNNLTFAAGGIYNDQGMVTVSNSSFTGNTLTDRVRDIHNNRGTVTVDNSTFANDPIGSATRGGGIHNFGGTLSVSNSTFSGNRAYNGGAINNENPGTVTVSNSTFHGNKATNLGGGICSQNAGTVVVTNSTFFGNEAAGGGGVVNAQSLTFTLKNTIIANSPAGNNCLGMITDGGRNLSYPDASCPGVNPDPLLGPLQMNGGPTMTMGLGPGSAAIDAGDDATCAAPPVNNLDQRGVTRPVGPHCDIGAFEAIYSTMPTRAWLPILLAQ